MLKLDLTKKDIPGLVITDEATGEKVRYTFSKILNRQQRAMMMKKVGKGNQAREVADLEKLFKTCIATMGPIQVDGVSPDAFDENHICHKPDVIAQILLIAENQGGFPEEHVEQLVKFLMGENVLGEERGKD